MPARNTIPGQRRHILPWFFGYLVLAIVMFGSMLAALGATCNDAKDAQNLTFPAMIPVFIPMFMLLGYSPELVQATYRVGDSVTNVISPLMSYFPLIVAFMKKYADDAGIGTVVATMLLGAIFFTGASASVKGYPNSASFAMGKFALRGLAQRIIELDRGRLRDWTCDYDTFVRRRDEALRYWEVVWSADPDHEQVRQYLAQDLYLEISGQQNLR